MFVPAISTLFWVLVYSWPAEFASNPLDVATSPADLQLLKGPQVANVSSNPELLITKIVNATRSELFPISDTYYQVELTSPAIGKTIAVGTLWIVFRREINECHAEVVRGHANIVPFAMTLMGPTPESFKFCWYNLDGRRRGSYAELRNIFTFLLYISTTERIERPNPWFAHAFSYAVYWTIDRGSPPEPVGIGTVGL